MEATSSRHASFSEPISTLGAHMRSRYRKLEKDVYKEGQFKTLWRAVDLDLGIEVAWNEVNRALSEMRDDERARFEREITLLHHLDHTSIVRFQNAWKDDDLDRIVFITELLSSGTLESFLQRAGQGIKPRVVKKWARQIIEGVGYLHRQRIVHRDLRSANLFIDGRTGTVKIGDLGHATELYAELKRTMRVDFERDLVYQAPEMWEEGKGDEKVDIFALGMVILQMVSGEQPYSECVKLREKRDRIVEGIPPESVNRVQDAEARDLISRCLSKDPKERPTAQDLLQHPFLKEAASVECKANHGESAFHFPRLGPSESSAIVTPRGFAVEIVLQILFSPSSTTKQPEKKNIEFVFFPGSDTADAVAHEMVTELELPDTMRTAIRDEIRQQCESCNLTQ